MRTPHDQLFKELLSTFFQEFLQLFLPQLMEYVEPDSLVMLDKELYTRGLRRVSRQGDLVIKARVRGEPSYILIHLEHESGSRTHFPRRMFGYFARYHENEQWIPIYPVVIYSYSQPKLPGRDRYEVSIADMEVLRFRFHVIQLNRLRWQDYLNHANPVACALMARMQVHPADRPRVKLECLRLLVRLRLEPRKSQTIEKFIDNYLLLNAEEEVTFQHQLQELDPEEEQQMQEVTTSWQRKGRQEGRLEGRHEGRHEGTVNTLKIILATRFGPSSQALESRLQQCQDIKVLERLAAAVAAGSSLEELERLI